MNHELTIQFLWEKMYDFDIIEFMYLQKLKVNPEGLELSIGIEYQL